MRVASTVADAAALHIDSDSDAGAYANTYSMRVYAELSDANTYSVRVYGELSDADAHCYALRRSSVSFRNPNPYSLHRCGLRDADTHTVSGRRELPNADGDPDSYPDTGTDGDPDS